MKFVVDSNRIVASLLKDSTTREILYNHKFTFIAPEFIKEEIIKYKEQFIDKAKLSSEEFNMLLSLFFEKVKLISKECYQKDMDSLKKEISDLKDIPYLACCIATNSEGIWSHDPHFLEQDKVKIFTNKDLLDLSRE